MRKGLLAIVMFSALSVLPATAAAQDYSSSSLNPFSDTSANPCKPIAIYPPQLDDSQYRVQICAFAKSGYQNIEYKNLRHSSPRSTTDPITGETQLFPAETYHVQYQEDIMTGVTLRYTPCPNGVIMSYIYDTPSDAGKFVSSIYVDRNRPEATRLPETYNLSPDIARHHCPA